MKFVEYINELTLFSIIYLKTELENFVKWLPTKFSISADLSASVYQQREKNDFLFVLEKRGVFSLRAVGVCLHQPIHKSHPSLIGIKNRT